VPRLQRPRFELAGGFAEKGISDLGQVGRELEGSIRELKEQEVQAVTLELKALKESLKSEVEEARVGWESGIRALKERELEEVRSELTALKESFRSTLERRLIEKQQAEIERAEQERLEKERRDACSWKGDGSLEGIIAYLTKKHQGNVCEKGIVTITSKSLCSWDPCYARKNVADLTSDSHFQSDYQPGEWICWDFGEMRFRPTHYTLKTRALYVWVVEGSVDGTSWTVLDQQTNCSIGVTKPWTTASFPILNAPECCFIRLTHSSRGYCDWLILMAVEFFARDLIH
jgi:hypothetical protein